MAKRGKVLREPVAGPGLLIAEGRQYQFDSASVWKSQIAPKAGIVVDIEFDAQGRIAAINAVPEAILSAEEGPRTSGGSARFAYSGFAQLLAASVLVLSWFFLTAISLQVPYAGTLELTFWQLLQLGSRGYGLVALFAVAGPFAHHFRKERQVALGGLLPLFFLVCSGALLFRRMDIFVPSGGDALYQQLPIGTRSLPNAVSLGLGSYVSAAISVYFALLSAKQFRQSKQTEHKQVRQLQKAAA